MNLEELKQAIAATLAAIEQVKEDIEKTTDPTEKRKLIRHKKELQYLQLWHIEQLESHQDT
jgi:hypothetical protein